MSNCYIFSGFQLLGNVSGVAPNKARCCVARRDDIGIAAQDWH